MNADSFIKARLADYVLDECWRQADVEEMTTIALVIRNRVDAGWRGGDWMAVIEDAPLKRYRDFARSRGVDLREYTVKQFFGRIDDIYSGEFADELTNGAVYYGQLHAVTNKWFMENIARDTTNHPRIAQIGLLSFFG
jgi:hypothetical protein